MSILSMIADVERLAELALSLPALSSKSCSYPRKVTFRLSSVSCISTKMSSICFVLVVPSDSSDVQAHTLMK